MAVNCDQCGRNVPEGANACQYCGELVSELVKVHCKSCDRDVDGTRDSCEFCGAAIADIETTHCPGCNRNLVGDQETCPYCGTVLQPDKVPNLHLPATTDAPMRWEIDDSDELDEISRDANKTSYSALIALGFVIFFFATAGIFAYLSLTRKTPTAQVLHPEVFRNDSPQDICSFMECKTESSGSFFVATDAGDISVTLCSRHRGISGEVDAVRDSNERNPHPENVLTSLAGALAASVVGVAIYKLLS